MQGCGEGGGRLGADLVAMGPLGTAWVCPPANGGGRLESIYAADWTGRRGSGLLLLPDVRSLLVFWHRDDGHGLLWLPPRSDAQFVVLPCAVRLLGVICRPGTPPDWLEHLITDERREHPVGWSLQLRHAVPLEWRQADWMEALAAFQEDLVDESPGSFSRGLASLLRRSSLAVLGRVPAMAARLGLHQRTLARQIRQRCALPPKRVLHIGRLRRILHAAGEATEPDWAGLAIDAGFYDQPHLCEALRQATGLTPRGLHRLLRAHSDGADLSRRLGILPVLRPPGRLRGRIMREWDLAEGAIDH